MRDAVSAMSQAAHRDKVRGGRENCRGAGRALGCFRSWLILARMVPADAPGVLLDGRQGGIKGYEGALLDAGHGLPRMAFRVDGELLGGCFRNPTHGAAEQVCQGPFLAVVG